MNHVQYIHEPGIRIYTMYLLTMVKMNGDLLRKELKQALFFITISKVAKSYLCLIVKSHMTYKLSSNMVYTHLL